MFDHEIYPDMYLFIGFAFNASADWTFTPYPSDKPVENIISSIAVDHDGVLWASSGNDLWTMKNNQWQNHSKEITTLIHNGIHDILVGNDNTKWFVSSSEYTIDPFVFSFNGVNWKQYSFLIYSNVQGVPPSQCPVYMLNKIALDINNIFWFAGYGGVIQLNPDLSWIVYYQNGNFGNTSLFNHAIVYSLAVDPDNVKWFGIGYADSAVNNGLASYNGISWKLYNQADVPVAGKNISNIACGIDGSIITSTNNGMYLYKNSLWRKIESLYGSNLVSPAADKKGGFWLLVYDSLHKPVLFKGVLRLTYTDTEMFFNQSLFNDFFEYKIYVDTNNTKWFVSRNGIWRYDDTITGVSQVGNRPAILSLLNHPNPFNSSTSISLYTPKIRELDSCHIQHYRPACPHTHFQ